MNTNETITLCCFSCHNYIDYMNGLGCPHCKANNMIPFNNRKQLIKECIDRINNYMDDCFVAEHYAMLDNAKHDTIIDVIDSLLGAINYRYGQRANYESNVKKVYDDNIKVIKELREEIKKLID